MKEYKNYFSLLDLRLKIITHKVKLKKLTRKTMVVGDHIV